MRAISLFLYVSPSRHHRYAGREGPVFPFHYLRGLLYNLPAF